MKISVSICSSHLAEAVVCGSHCGQDERRSKDAVSDEVCLGVGEGDEMVYTATSARMPRLSADVVSQLLKAMRELVEDYGTLKRTNDTFESIIQGTAFFPGGPGIVLAAGQAVCRLGATLRRSAYHDAIATARLDGAPTGRHNTSDGADYDTH